MFKHVLIATDGSELSRAAAATGVELARSLKARVTLVHCFRPYEGVVEESLVTTLSRLQYEAHCEVLTVKSTEHALDLASGASLEAEAVPVYAEAAWTGILDTARARGCDVIVMGSHGRGGVASALLGSQALKVLGHSSVPVLIVRSGAA
jgi:nucleotide-binding universal stress UspA family protein